jgi:hypothetical protein
MLRERALDEMGDYDRDRVGDRRCVSFCSGCSRSSIRSVKVGNEGDVEVEVHVDHAI